MSLYNSYTDQQLISLLQDSDEVAFTELYNRYWADIYRNAMKILHSQNDAEDMVQELFESLWKRRSQLQIMGSVAGYLYSSTRYLSIHFIEKNIATYPYRQSLSEAVEPVMIPSVESAIDAKSLEAAIDGIIGKLPEKMREVFRLSRKENLTYKEIAEKLNISEETVKKQVYNALKVIRQNIGNAGSFGCIMMIIYAISFSSCCHF